MTKNELITTIRDSLLSGNQKEAEDAVDEYAKRESIEVLKFMESRNFWIFNGMAFSTTEDTELTFQELYNLYLDHKKLNP